MPLPDRIDAVLLDSGGVLLVPSPDAFREVLAPFGVEPDDETCFRGHYAGMREVDRVGAPDWSVIDRVVARELGVAETDLAAAVAPIEHVYNGLDWVPVAGAAQALRGMQDDGYPLAVVSNARGTMEQYLADHRICAVDGSAVADVAIVVDSHVVGIEKPDPAIFSIALEELGLGPEHCIYVGDSVHFDVNGSRAAGLHPVHVDPYRLCAGTDDHHHVDSVAALAAELPGRS